MTSLEPVEVLTEGEEFVVVSKSRDMHLTTLMLEGSGGRRRCEVPDMDLGAGIVCEGEWVRRDDGTYQRQAPAADE